MSGEMTNYKSLLSIKQKILSFFYYVSPFPLPYSPLNKQTKTGGMFTDTKQTNKQKNGMSKREKKKSSVTSSSSVILFLVTTTTTVTYTDDLFFTGNWTIEKIIWNDIVKVVWCKKERKRDGERGGCKSGIM